MRTSHIVLLVTAFLLAPATAWAQFSLLSSMENDHNVEPGGSYTGAITVRNTTDSPRVVTVYQRDSRYDEEGASYADPGTLPRSNAGWISFAPESFTIPAQDDFTLTYTISVPRDDSLRGSYWSVLMVESAISQPQTANSSSKGSQISLGLKFRYAVQVAAHLSAGAFDLAVSNFKADADSEAGTILQLDLRNGGDLMRDPDVWVELYDAAGKLVGRFEGLRKRLYPGSVIRQSIELGSLEPGAYNALILVDAGEDELYGAQYAVNL